MPNWLFRLSLKLLKTLSKICLRLLRKQCYVPYCPDTATPPPLMVVLMTVAPCLNKDLHTNGHEKETWIRFNNNFNANVDIPIHVEYCVIQMKKYIWILDLNHGSITFLTDNFASQNASKTRLFPIKFLMKPQNLQLKWSWWWYLWFKH